ncbi:MAG: tRNA uridine-5-carboxymethylaminomethyl(34) synthesis enzyme MnmG, partial [Clostridiales bacterium]|nr:tRNA uridine-5-carboxymethylaminomethyl(34) synthesis enzyme MnmG [Clostridiales bacterium]
MNETNDHSGKTFTFDAIVVGAGHAGIEAGLALARLNRRVCMLSISLDNVGYLACNPSIGGTAKGHLVREIDALGGEMGVAADRTLTQLRMLNRSKGSAVHSLRAQVDKYAYHAYMKRTLETQPGLTLRQGEVKRLLTGADGGRIEGVETVYGQRFLAPAVVLACGVYLKSCVIVGDVIENKGPASFNRANHLSDSLTALGLSLRRFKTGTPARVKLSGVELSALEEQRGETDIYSFSALSNKVAAAKRVCYLGYTNPATHDLIRQNLHLAPKYAGLISGAGARYCPSIEDKIVRFRDKERHQFFLEPEGEGTEEYYVQGLSSSLPADIQYRLYRTIKGFENVEIMRDAYAIEYDCIDPTTLFPSLMHKACAGLFFAGQINGTSGYEEAAAQGLMAGINAARYVGGQEPVVLSRAQAYIGVLIDDLVTKGTDEPYRMMTSRAEFRLLLRQDNADLRLTEIGRQIGLAGEKRCRLYQRRKSRIDRAKQALAAVVPPKSLAPLFLEAGEPLPATGMTVADILKRGGLTPALMAKYAGLFPGIHPTIYAYMLGEARYAGYLTRALNAQNEQQRLEALPLPARLDYTALKGLRIEAAEKLNKLQPRSVGQAARLPGVNPADITVLLL